MDLMQECPKYIESIGNYNELPKPYRKSSLQEFWHYLFTWGVPKTEYRQVIVGGYDYYRNAEIFYYHDKAFALVAVVDGARYTEPEVYQIGCNHDWEVQSPRMCCRQYICNKCGTSFEEDSSD